MQCVDTLNSMQHVDTVGISCRHERCVNSKQCVDTLLISCSTWTLSEFFMGVKKRKKGLFVYFAPSISRGTAFEEWVSQLC